MNPEDNLEESIIWPMPTGAEQASGQFPDPFRLAPHPTATACAKALQEYLQCHLSIMHELTQTGKMFGVLAVENERGEKGFLAAFSGKLCGKNILPRFVPPVFDLSDETLFFRKGEKEISGLNETIEEIEHSVSMTQASEKWKKQKAQWEHTLREARHSAMENKKSRDEKRRRIALSEDEIWKKEALDRLNKESAREKSELKKLRQSAEVETHSARNTLDLLLAKAEELKTLRKEKSAELQKALFEAYIFPNGKGEEKNLQEIFSAAGLLTPPAGAGDCAAPKLVHFALRQKLKPLALAEFWWGAPPVDEIRKPGFFYPPCRGKCEPILGFMLRGLPVEKTEIRQATTWHLPVVFEDEYLLAINKPEGLLSLPGKGSGASAAGILGPGYMPIHRLDMDTSGILLFAKSREMHQKMQKLFLNKSIEKRYLALLEGHFRGNREGLVSLPLRTDLEDRPRQKVCFDSGKPASTRWNILGTENGNTRVHFFPVSGRTHQLRVHAAHPEGMNCPILGDRLYGTPSKRLFLHAEKLRFIHPVTGKTVCIEAPGDF